MSYYPTYNHGEASSSSSAALSRDPNGSFKENLGVTTPVDGAKVAGPSTSSPFRSSSNARKPRTTRGQTSTRITGNTAHRQAHQSAVRQSVQTRPQQPPPFVIPEGSGATIIPANAGPDQEPPVAPGQVLYRFPVVPPRPPFMPQVGPAHLKALDPSLERVPLPFIKDVLLARKTLLVQGLQSVESTRANVVTGDKDVLMNVTDEFPLAQRQLPSHVICVVNNETNAAKVCPIHALVLVAHCARIPVFPPPAASEPDANGQINFPIVTLKLPHPESFMILLRYLYRKEFAIILDMLIPTPAGFATPLMMNSQADMTEATANALSQTYSIGFLLQRLRFLHGFWQNVLVLGISELALWKIMDAAWTVLLKALLKAKALYESEEPTPGASGSSAPPTSAPAPMAGPSSS